MSQEAKVTDNRSSVATLVYVINVNKKSVFRKSKQKKFQKFK